MSRTAGRGRGLKRAAFALTSINAPPLEIFFDVGKRQRPRLGRGGNGHGPGDAANESPGGTDVGREEMGGGFTQYNGTGPPGNSAKVSNKGRKACRESGLVCYHIRAGNAGHWPDIKKDFINGKLGLTLHEGGPFEAHRPGSLKIGKAGPNSGCGYRIFFPRTEVEIMKSSEKEGIPTSAEMRECKES